MRGGTFCTLTLGLAEGLVLPWHQPLPVTSGQRAVWTWALPSAPCLPGLQVGRTRTEPQAHTEGQHGSLPTPSLRPVRGAVAAAVRVPAMGVLSPNLSVSSPGQISPSCDSGRWCRLSWLLWGSQGTAITPLRQWVWVATLATLDLSVFASSLGMNV